MSFVFSSLDWSDFLQFAVYDNRCCILRSSVRKVSCVNLEDNITIKYKNKDKGKLTEKMKRSPDERHK
jgi:hypothetical protein